MANIVLGSDINTVDELGTATLETGHSVEQARLELVTKIGENIQVRRFEKINSRGIVACYLHGSRIGVIVDFAGGDAELG